MSGFRRSESVASSGPREENPAICGAGGSGLPVVSVGCRATVMAGLAATFALSSRASGALTCTVGMTCWSGSVEEGVTLTRIMPTPPARFTSALLAVRSTTPRSQTTIFPATFAGSRVFGPQRAGAVGGVAAAAVSARTTGLAGTPARMIEAPRYLVPSENSAVPCSSLLNVLAATVVSHGAPWFTVLAVGPELPAEAATKTPADAAERKARATGSVVVVVLPEIE